MDRPDRRRIVRAILERHPRSFAEQLSINVSRNKPAVLYRWLIASLLFSARISADQAQHAARALFRAGWRTPHRMADSTWRQRVTVLNRAGYARYDESTARYIADTTELLLERYGGDLRQLREAAGCDPARERTCLTAFKGIGETGADIFFREVQLAWGELYPFADAKALAAAREMGLEGDAEALAALVGRREDLPRLLSGLVSAKLSGSMTDITSAVARSGC